MVQVLEKVFTSTLQHPIQINLQVLMLICNIIFNSWWTPSPTKQFHPLIWGAFLNALFYHWFGK
jgi:hypothetical protein